MNANEQLIKAQREYIEFLSNEMNQTAAYLYVHNIRSSNETIQRGEQFRKAISDATALVEQSVPSDEDIENAAKIFYKQPKLISAYSRGAKYMRDGKIYVEPKNN